MLALFVIAVVVFFFLLRRLQRRVDQLQSAVNRLLYLEHREMAPEQAMPESASPPAPIAAPTVPFEPRVPPRPELSQPSSARPPAFPAEESAPPEPQTLTNFITALWKRLGLGGVEWEAIIGGSWLNKLGVLIFVIGLALFVGYSLRELGPLGRVLVGAAVSLGMLIGGAALERQARYAAYGRGLIGGGWAGLYFTTYAAHGMAGAGVITNPALATALLILVALGMILHSLRYRSEVVTGVAYFVAFATLAVSPLSDFAVVAAVPLAASLLYVAQRFKWHRMMIAGLAVTYGSYLLSTAGEPVSTIGFIRGQSVLATYWLMFELFDLIETARVRRDRVVALFPLNACAFIGTSILEWSRFSPHQLDVFLIASAGAFLIDGLVRVKIRPPRSFEPAQSPLERAAEGGYEGSVTVASASAAAAAFIRFSGLDINIALLLEAEMLTLAGLNLNEEYLQILGGLLFVVPALKLIFFDLPSVTVPSYLGFQAPATFFGLKMGRWSLVAALTAAAGYFNRWLTAKRYETQAYSYFASAVALIVIFLECLINYRGLGWLIFGALVFEAGLRAVATDLRAQGYVAGALGALTLLGVGVLGWPGASADGRQAALALAAVITYALALQMQLAPQGQLADMEREAVRDSALGAGNAFAAVLLWYVLPAPLVAVGWALMMLVLLYLGIAWAQRDLRWHSYIIAILVFARSWSTNFDLPGTLGGIIPLRVATASFAIAALYAAEFMSPSTGETDNTDAGLTQPERLLAQADRYARVMFALLATALLTLLLYHEVPGDVLTEAWALEGTPLLILGFTLRERVLRLSGLLLLGACVFKVFLYDLRNLETLPRIVSFIVLGLLMLAVSFIYTRFYERLKRYL